MKATLNDVMSPFTLPGKAPPSGVRLATFQSRMPVACIRSRCDRSLSLVCSGRGAKGLSCPFSGCGVASILGEVCSFIRV